MENKKYKISVLSDFSRLDEIYRLTHETLVEAGDIQPGEMGKIVSFPEIDVAPETSIIIAERDNVIIGTISFTIDGPNGLHISQWFREETNTIRNASNGPIGAFWRIATERKCRGKRALVLDLMTYAFKEAIRKKCDYALLICTHRHFSFYQNFIGAEIVARRESSIQEGCKVDTAMMKMNVLEGWGKFNKKRPRVINNTVNRHPVYSKNKIVCSDLPNTVAA